MTVFCIYIVFNIAIYGISFWTFQIDSRIKKGKIKSDYIVNQKYKLPDLYRYRGFQIPYSRSSLTSKY